MPEPPRIKILFWPGWWYPHRKNPYLGIFIKKHAEAISLYCDITVLYVVEEEDLEKRYEIVISENQFTSVIVYYQKPKKIPFLAFFQKQIRYLKASFKGLKVIVKNHGMPQILHVNVNPPIGLIVMQRTILRRVPCVFTEHWTGYLPSSSQYRGIFRKWATRLFVRHLECITTVSEDLHKHMVSHGLINTYHVIPNAVDAYLFRNHKAPQGKQKTRFIHVSFLRACKNVEGIVYTLKELSKLKNDFEFHIIGDGPEFGKLVNLATELQLINTIVFFHGIKTVEEIAIFMGHSDCFVLFSDFENSPCVIGEAMMAGLPVIATDINGIPEHVNQKNGILISPRDNEALLQALLLMIEKRLQLNNRQIKKYAEETFSYETIGKKFFSLYQEILENKAKKVVSTGKANN
jgi:glycosyltransferase involved in cell wall biosynthesis